LLTRALHRSHASSDFVPCPTLCLLCFEVGRCTHFAAKRVRCWPPIVPPVGKSAGRYDLDDFDDLADGDGAGGGGSGLPVPSLAKNPSLTSPDGGLPSGRIGSSTSRLPVPRAGSGGLMDSGSGHRERERDSGGGGGGGSGRSGSKWSSGSRPGPAAHKGQADDDPPDMKRLLLRFPEVWHWTVHWCGT
jgi:hypothetical protein